METKKREDPPPKPRAPVKAEGEEGAVSGHTCGVCSRTFPLLSSLSQHMRRHTQEKPYKCPFCEHRTAQKGSLKAHVRGHKLGLFHHSLCDRDAESPEEQSKSPNIPNCADAEAEKSAVVNGKVKKKGGKRKLNDAEAMENGAEADGGCCTCIICGQAFPQTLLLKSHMKVHSGPEDYGCRICGRRFRQAWFFQSHVHAHRSKAARKGDKASDSLATINGVPQDPLSLVNEVCCYELCGICGNFFPDRTSLQVHEQLHKSSSPTRDPLQDGAEVSDSQAKRFFMEGLNLTSVELRKAPEEKSLGRQVPELDPVCSYQTLMLATTGRLALTHLSQKCLAQDTEKVKRVSSKQGKKRKQVAASSSQSKKLKLETDPEQRSKSPAPAKSSNKKSHITLNGLGRAFYEELHSKKVKDVHTSNTESLYPGGIKVYFCQHCDFCTGSPSNLRSHLCTQHSDLLDPLRNYATALSNISQSGLEAFRNTDHSEIQTGQFNGAGVKWPVHANDAESALNLSLLKVNKRDLVVKTDEVISHECSYCVYTSYYPEVLWMHQQIEHKVNASCPMAPKWAVSNSSLKSLKAAAPQWRRTGPPPFLKGKDCPALSVQKSQRTKPQDTVMQGGGTSTSTNNSSSNSSSSSNNSSGSKLSGLSKSKHQPKDSCSSDRTRSSRKTGFVPPKKPKRKQATERGSSNSGVQTSSLSSTMFNKNPSAPQPANSLQHQHRAAAEANFPQEGLGFMLARHHSGTSSSSPADRAQPRRHPADSSSGLKDLDLWAALNMLAHKAYSDPSDPVHVAPAKAESAGEKPGDVDVLGLLRGHTPHDLASLCQQWSFIDPTVDPKALFQFSGNLAKVHSSPESSLVNGCCAPQSGSLHKGP